MPVGKQLKFRHKASKKEEDWGPGGEWKEEKQSAAVQLTIKLELLTA